MVCFCSVRVGSWEIDEGILGVISRIEVGSSGSQGDTKTTTELEWLKMLQDLL